MPDDWDIKVLYDGDCPLCKREVAMLRRMDRRNRVAMEDIADPAFDPSRYGRTQRDVMDRIHGVLPDGTVIEGMDVFRGLYNAVGWGWLMNWTRLPIARPITDAMYRGFARHRLTLTGRRGCDAGRCVTSDHS